MEKLKIALVILILSGLSVFGFYFVNENSSENLPMYTIRQDGNWYHTNEYKIDSTGCINFIDIHQGIFKERTKETTICGGRYTIVKNK